MRVYHMRCREDVHIWQLTNYPCGLAVVARVPHPSRQPAPNACAIHCRISVHSGGTTEHFPPASCRPRRATPRISTVQSVLSRAAPHPLFPSPASVQSAARRPRPAEASCVGCHPRAARVGPASELAADFSLRGAFSALIAARS